MSVTTLETPRLQVRANTVNIGARTAEAVLSTEAAIPMPDPESRFEMVPEILRNDGVVAPSQVPLLDGHDRSSIGKILGSVSNIRVQSGDLVGLLRFASDPDGDKALGLVRDGHLTDVSVGYRIANRTRIKAGQTSLVSGRTYAGPANVVTGWYLREVSLTPIGANPDAKMRCRYLRGDPTSERNLPQIDNDSFAGKFASLICSDDRRATEDFLASVGGALNFDTEFRSVLQSPAILRWSEQATPAGLLLRCYREIDGKNPELRQAALGELARVMTYLDDNGYKLA